MDAVPAAFLWLGKNLTQNVTLVGEHTYFLHSNVPHDRPRASAYTTATCYSDLKSAAIYQLYLMYFFILIFIMTRCHSNTRYILSITDRTLLILKTELSDFVFTRGDYIRFNLIVNKDNFVNFETGIRIIEACWTDVKRKFRKFVRICQWLKWYNVE